MILMLLASRIEFKNIKKKPVLTREVSYFVISRWYSPVAYILALLDLPGYIWSRGLKVYFEDVKSSFKPGNVGEAYLGTFNPPSNTNEDKYFRFEIYKRHAG